MQQPGSHGACSAPFAQGLIHILLGTQMIAKGLDFPNVTLVGVVNADVGLHLPDFRSAERTFQLLSQVAGRAGRGPRGGRVLVQTFTPEHPCIALAATHDYAASRPASCRIGARTTIRRISGWRGSSFAARIRKRPPTSPNGWRRLSCGDWKGWPAGRRKCRASARAGRGAGVSAEGLFSLSLPAAIAERRRPSSVAAPGPGSVRQPANVEHVVDVDPLNML